MPQFYPDKTLPVCQLCGAAQGVMFRQKDKKIEAVVVYNHAATCPSILGGSKKDTRPKVERCNNCPHNACGLCEPVEEKEKE